MRAQYLAQGPEQKPSRSIRFIHLLPWANSGLAFLSRLLPHLSLKSIL